MLFKPELAQAILEGRKTVTRRERTGKTVDGRWQDDPCRYKVGGGPGGSYAVCPGRGKHSIGRIRVVSIRAETMADLTDDEVRREGFASCAEFEQTWLALHGRGNYLDPVWRIEFELVPTDV